MCCWISIYIPPGAVDKIRLFGQQLARVCSKNDEVLVGMDANARNMMWNEYVGHRVSRKMGEELLEVLLDSRLEVLNNGMHTFHKGGYSAALDVTAAKGLPSSTWKVLNDEINSDHSPIIIEVGQAVTNGVTQRKDWKNMV